MSVHACIYEVAQDKKYPVRSVNGDGRNALWFLDCAAARRME
jgi:hypothetical protein